MKQKQKLDFAKEVITKNGGEIASVIENGNKKTCLYHKKYDRGNYFVIHFKPNSANLIAELVRNLRITEEIIRFLIVKYENKLENFCMGKVK